jgi:dTDP-L-rhamnose 4-epimerase
VAHLAARVGVGQSMYEISEYTSVNGVGTGVLLEALLDHPVERLLVASSMSVYGEGLYVDDAGEPVPSAARRRADLEAGRWEPVGVQGQALTPVATPETKAPTLSSVYALGKYDQERLCLMFGEAYKVPTVALRFFNAYGPTRRCPTPNRRAGDLRPRGLLNGRPPLVFEGRRAAARLRQRPRRRTRLRARAVGGGRCERRGVNVGSGQGVTVKPDRRRAGDPARPHPTSHRDHREVPRRRHPALLRRRLRAEQVLGYTPQVPRRRGWPSWPECSRGRWRGRRRRRHGRAPSRGLTT